jgi:excisionase family DNA binding protein
MPRTLDLDECAALLKVHPNTVAERAAAGDLPGAKIGRAWVFIEDEVLDYLRAQVQIQVAQRKTKQARQPIAYFVPPTKSRRKPLPRLPILPIVASIDEPDSSEDAS